MKNLALKNFLQTQRLATISTIDEQGKPHGAVVYFSLDDKGMINIATTKKSHKATNIANNSAVALVVTSEEQAKTVQIEGTAKIVTAATEKIGVIGRIARVANNNPLVKNFPALFKFAMHGGDVACIKVTVDKLRYSDFSGSDFEVVEATGEDLKA